MALAAAALAAPSAVRAQAASAGKAAVAIRLDAAVLVPTGAADLERAFGPDFSFEYRFRQLVGAEAALIWGRHDVAGTSASSLDQTTLLLGANVHVVGRERADFYLGPTVGYAFWGDLVDSTTATRTPMRSDFVYGASAGLDVPFGARWAANLGLRYLWSRVGPASGGVAGTSVNPVTARAGIAYRF